MRGRAASPRLPVTDKMAGSLSFFLTGEVMGAMQRQISPLTALVVVVIVILIVALGWFFWSRQPSGPPPTEQSTPQPPGLPSATQPAPSPAPVR
ncbi:MAG: hypothetical protein SLRJCFUN_000240 [Candidatus Fervidibacter sp.]